MPLLAGAPAWAAELALAFESGAHSQFIVSGNVGDRMLSADGKRLVPLASYLQDVLLAATATSTTRCLVLTHGVAPSIAIRYRAEEAEIPIVVTPHDTVEAMRRIDAALLRLRFSHPQKLDHWRGLLAEHLRLEPLGLAPAEPAAV